MQKKKKNLPPPVWIFQRRNWPDHPRRREPIKRNVRWCNVLSKKCNTDNFGVRCLFLFYFTFLAHATCSYFGAAPLRLLRPLGSLRLVTRHIVHFIFGSVLAWSCLALFFHTFFFLLFFFRDRGSARMWAAVRHDHESGKRKIKLMLGSVKKLSEDTQLGPGCVAAGATSLE